MNIKRLNIVLKKKLASNVKTYPKSFYAYVRSQSKTKTSVGPLKNGDGVLISDDLQMSEILNSYFGSVFMKENLRDKLPEVEQVFKGDLSSNITDIIITPEVKSNKAPGMEGLVSDFFQKTSDTICLPLSIIFRKSLDERLEAGKCFCYLKKWYQG